MQYVVLRRIPQRRGARMNEKPEKLTVRLYADDVLVAETDDVLLYAAIRVAIQWPPAEMKTESLIAYRFAWTCKNCFEDSPQVWTVEEGPRGPSCGLCSCTMVRDRDAEKANEEMYREALKRREAEGWARQKH